MKLKKKKSQQTTLRLRPDLHEGLRAWSFEKNVPVNIIVQDLIEDAIERRNGKKK